MDDQTTDNQTTAEGTADNNAASIESIMGGMVTNAPEAQPGDNGDKAEGNSGNQDAGTQAPAWTQQLPKELRDNADFMKQMVKFNTIGDLGRSYSELESKIGKTIIQPGEDASEEDIAAFYSKLGKPDNVEGYGLTEEKHKAFIEAAYKNNLTVKQAQALYADLEATANNAINQAKANLQAQAKATTEALKQEYGNHYNAKIQMLQRGVNEYGGKALGEKLQATGLIADPDVVRMFIKLGEQASEAGTVTKTNNDTGYQSIAEGGHLSFGNDFK